MAKKHFYIDYLKKKFVISIFGIKIQFKISDIIIRRHFYKILSSIKDSNIYVFLWNLGEIYIFLSWFRNSSEYANKNSVFICTKNYHLDLVSMFCPDIKTLFIPEFQILKNTKINFPKHIRIIFSNEASNDIIKAIKESPQTFSYPLFIRNYLNIDARKFFTKPQMTKYNDKLNLNKFIFVCPEAESCPSLTVQECETLYDSLQKLGYDVFFNITKNFDDYNFGVHSFLSINEAYQLAERSQGIICVRSGFSEILSCIRSTPIHILYTNISDNNKYFIPSFTQYPDIGKNIFEIDRKKISFENLKWLNFKSKNIC